MVAEKTVPHHQREIVEARKRIISSNDLATNNVQKLSDFYSTSDVRDLLFHIQEHRFTIPQIEKIISDLGLHFMGFSLYEDTYNDFKLNYPEMDALYNLNKWHEYETKNITTFIGMYDFWVQKI
jgi:hypothetical protein